jgi:hypothetical protein
MNGKKWEGIQALMRQNSASRHRYEYAVHQIKITFLFYLFPRHRDRAVKPKVYKYKVISTNFNDDIYGIEIVYLEEKLHILVNIPAMGSLVLFGTMVLPPAHNYYIGCGATIANKRPLVLDVCFYMQ